MDGVLTQLPPLRQELEVFRGPSAYNGATTWSVYDPANQRYYRIGQTECDILAAWHLADAKKIVEHINRTGTQTILTDDITRLYRFLLNHNLLQLSGIQAVEHYLKKAGRGRDSIGQRLLKHYLFFKIPLCHPDPWLRRTYPYVRWVYQRRVFSVLMVLLALNLYLLAERWEMFAHTFVNFISGSGALYYAATLALVKLCHELGHAYTAHRYGCRVTTMGVAFLVLMPIFYTDTTDAWKLASKRQRMAIAAAGVLTELALAIVATSLWHILPDGALRASLFFVATTSWTVTLLINLNPFMRFDGYYLLADFLGIDNLQQRAFSLGRWRLRRLLFGVNQPPPERLTEKLRRILIVYAWSTWVYRFALFLGIALLVYHFFFKALGVFLMLVEIWVFIVLPIFREMHQWYRERSQFSWNINTRLTGAALITGLLVFFVPWHGSVQAPAVLSAGQQTEVFLPLPGKLDKIYVDKNQYVEAQQPLMQFDSSGLTIKQEQSQTKIEALRWQLAFHGQEQRLNSRRRLTQSELDSALNEYRSLQDNKERLLIKAPMSGFVIDINQQLNPGQWFAKNEPLLKVARFDSYKIVAYVDEAHLSQILSGQPAVFYPEQMEWPRIRCRITKIDNAASTHIPPAFADRYHGTLPTKTEDKRLLVPQNSVFKVVLMAEQQNKILGRSIRGQVKIEAPASTLAAVLWKQILAGVISEFGF